MSVLDFPRGPLPAPCFVRLQCRRPDGFIEFEFSIGDPMLAVDLILPEAAYGIFCRANRVRELPAHPAHPDDQRTLA
jgi:phenol hydroxylase P0 protein